MAINLLSASLPLTLLGSIFVVFQSTNAFSPIGGLSSRRPRSPYRFDVVHTQMFNGHTRLSKSQHHSTPTDDDDQSTSISDGDGEDPSELPLTEERRANLFQFLLRDLQVDGVPLLGIDSDQVQTLQAAIWTTMAGLLATAIEAKEEQKVCLVFESIPIDALKAFVEDFQMLQNDERIQQSLLEVIAFRMSMVGNGVGPAITLSVTADDKLEIVDKTFAEENVSKAMRSFVSRIVQDTDDSIGMKHPVYRYCGFDDSCHTLSAFWNCICELQSKPEMDSIMLSFAAKFDPALTDLINRSLCLYRGDDVFELVHYGPTYDRSSIGPSDQAAFGHLPPISWLTSVLKQNQSELPESDLATVTNYQRRAPISAVLIKRVELLKDQAKHDEAAASSEIELNDGTKVSAFGLPLLAKSIKRLSATGVDQLEESLSSEIATIIS